VSEFLRRYGLFVVWAATILLFSALRPSEFFTASNLQTILASQAVLLILALSLVLPSSVGEFDLSIAGVLAVSLVIVGWLNVLHHWAIGPTIAVAVLVGVLTGGVNALLVVTIGLDSIVVTLGMGTVMGGLALGININTTGGISNSLVTSSRYEVFTLPLSFYYGVLFCVLLWYVMRFTPLGRYMLFVGAGREVARLSGIRVSAIRAGALIACSTIAALDGVILGGWLGASDPNVGATYLLPAYAAVFLGATTVTPGRFNPWGTFAAVYFLVTGITGLQILGYVGWVEQVFYGASLVIAVTFSHIAGKRRVPRHVPEGQRSTTAI
jgi:ribose transport system permease protein